MVLVASCGTIFHDWIGSVWGPKQSRWSGSKLAKAPAARGPNHNTSTPPSTDWKEKRKKLTRKVAMNVEFFNPILHWVAAPPIDSIVENNAACSALSKITARIKNRSVACYDWRTNEISFNSRDFRGKCEFLQLFAWKSMVEIYRFELKTHFKKIFIPITFWYKFDTSKILFT